jgi:hypothetical protein
LRTTNQITDYLEQIEEQEAMDDSDADPDYDGNSNSSSSSSSSNSSNSSSSSDEDAAVEETEVNRREKKRPEIRVYMQPPVEKAGCGTDRDSGLKYYL